jgi:hypothetical protein
MKRGLSASSPSAWRIFLTAVLTPCSNSTNVPAGHSACCNSSRGDHLARMSQQQGENLKRLVLEGHLAPPLAQFPGREVTANSGPATEAGPMKALIGSWLLASLGATMLAESRQPGLRIDVLVYNYAGLSAETLARAEGEAAGSSSEPASKLSGWTARCLRPRRRSIRPASLPPGRHGCSSGFSRGRWRSVGSPTP